MIKKEKFNKNIYNEDSEEDFVPKAFKKEKAESKAKKRIREEDVKQKKSIYIENEKKKDFNDKKKNRRITKHQKLKKFIIIVILIIILILGIYLGITSHRWKTLAKGMLVNENSVVQDTDGVTIATLGSERKNKKISLSEMPENLKNAYVAIEDERFYKHHGVDIKRTGAAIASYIFHFGSSSYGGSTITQQLVKNLTGDSTDSITRKVKEWWKAWQLESCLDKDEILEGYLNIIYVGPNMYGVETGAKYYFNKSTTQLSLEECAFLAGINNSPNSYNPFGDENNTEKIAKRTKTVLSKMLELKYINEESYNIAISNVEKGLNFKRGEIESSNGVYSYHTDALISEITEDIEKKYNISEKFATNYINMAGLTINSTQDSKVQKQTEIEFEKNKYIRNSKNGGNSSQAAMVIIDQKTGYVVGCTGGLGKKTTARSLNRATQSIRQTGSSIKPLSVLAPAIDKKLITAASIYDDTEKDFADGYHPTDYSSSLGKITVRRAVESSQNIPFVEIMEQLKPKNSMKYLEKMGISTLTKEDNSLVLALGGLQKGISPLEMAGGYATIANDGEYIEPTFYTKISNKSSETILETTQKKRKVFSKEVAYILKEILTQPVTGKNGTATYCAISGVDVAAKTGTTDENYDRWLCGFTPYYTAVTWYGFDQNETIEFNRKNPAGLLWANVMSRIHAGKKSAQFEKPSGIISATICAETGKKANTGCPNTYIENFLWNTVPGGCEKHIGKDIDTSNTINNVNNKVQEIVQGITQDIDAEDPQEKMQQNMTNKNNENTNVNSTNNNIINNNNNTNNNNNNNNNNNTTNNNIINSNASNNNNNSVNNTTGDNNVNIPNGTNEDITTTNTTNEKLQTNKDVNKNT